jgi:hypothetical protein
MNVPPFQGHPGIHYQPSAGEQPPQLAQPSVEAGSTPAAVSHEPDTTDLREMLSTSFERMSTGSGPAGGRIPKN